LLVFLVVLMTGVPLMLYTLALGADIDHGLLLSNILGLLLLTASYIALGLYISALTTQPIIAAIGAFAVLMGLWLADIGAAAENSPWHLISPLNHFQNFNNGLLDSSDAAFFILFTTVFLLLTMQRLHNNRLYG
jgi:ABC-2 type transport system permease protein